MLTKLIENLETVTKKSRESNFQLAAAAILAQGILLRSVGNQYDLVTKEQIREIESFLEGYKLLKNKKS